MAEIQRPCGDVDFCRPAVWCPCGPCIPNTIPVERGALRSGNQTVCTGSGSVDLKEVTRAPIAECVQHNADSVIALHVTVALHSMDSDAARVGVLTNKTKVDAVTGDDQAHLSFIRCRLSRLRRLLCEFEYRRISPYGLVQ